MSAKDRPHWTSAEAAFVPPARRDDIIEDEVDGEAILFDPRSGDVHRLNQTALAIWRQCDGRATTREIAERQADGYDVELITAQDHAEQVVAVLAESRLLRLSEDR